MASGAFARRTGRSQEVVTYICNYFCNRLDLDALEWTSYVARKQGL